jgi:Flp pilus assembly pilin Flp
MSYNGSLVLSLFCRAQTLTARLKDAEDGQALTEYPLVIFLIAILAIAALVALNGKIEALLTKVSHAAF